MGMHDKLDEKVFKIIQNTSSIRFGDIVYQMNAGRKPGKGVDPREVDRALQRLRKHGRLFFSRHGWNSW